MLKEELFFRNMVDYQEMQDSTVMLKYKWEKKNQLYLWLFNSKKSLNITFVNTFLAFYIQNNLLYATIIVISIGKESSKY